MSDNNGLWLIIDHLRISAITIWEKIHHMHVSGDAA
jgi:hypothetical protein